MTNILNSFRFSSHLLEEFPGAYAAYSLRQLSSSHTLSIRVRRDDNNEQDIGFAGGRLDTLAISNFCGASAGYVASLYDASPNGFDMSASTPSTQPKIYEGSAGLVVQNNNPAIQFDGVDDVLTNSNLNISRISMFAVAEKQDSGSLLLLMNPAAPNQALHEIAYTSVFSNYQDLSFYRPGSSLSGGSSLGSATGAQHLLSYFHDGAGSTLDSYQVAENENTLSLSTSGPFGYIAEISSIGARSIQGILYYPGKVQEIVIYNNDQSLNRGAIESNINTFYSIF